jgi:hypothetical protein
MDPLNSIVQQIEQLPQNEKWALLSFLIESLRQEASPTRRLCDYYGVGKGRGFRTAQEVDEFIREERASWES